MTIQITLLGEVAAMRLLERGTTQRQVLRGAQGRVAFAALTLAGNHGLSRDALADAIWGSRLPATWMSAVRSVLSRLRAFMCNVLPESGDPLLASAGVYMLRLPDDTRVDVLLAERLASGSGTALDAGRPEEAHRSAEKAVQLLRAPFLADRDSDWVEHVRARLGGQLLDALEVASRAALATGRHADALIYANEAATRAPLRESAHRCRMAAHAAAGNRSEALRVYQRLRKMLAREVGAEPAPETEAAYLSLLSTPTVQWRRAPSALHGPAPLVGRDAELAALSQAWDRASRGSRQLALLSGNLGVGKTRLAMEIAHRARTSGGLVLSGWCEPDPANPYQPFVEMLDGYLASTPSDSWPRLPAPLWDQLARLLPTLWQPAVTGERPNLSGLAAAVSELARQVSRQQPMLLVLDDLQWADEQTMSLLRAVIRRTAGCQLLVVATVRGRTSGCPGLGHIFNALRGPDELLHLPVAALGTTESAALVRRQSGGAALPERWLRWATAESGGNPWLLVELLRAGDAGPTGHLPPGFVDAVTGVVGTLRPPAADLLHAVCALPSPFGLRAARHASGLSLEETIGGLETALAAGLLISSPTRINGSTLRSYRFTHDLVRQALRESLDCRERHVIDANLGDSAHTANHGRGTELCPTCTKPGRLCGQPPKLIRRLPGRQSPGLGM